MERSWRSSAAAVSLLGLTACSGSHPALNPASTSAASRPVSAPSLDASQASAALRGGGYVLYFTHAISEPAEGEARVTLENCATQRALTAAGRAQAEAIGKAFQRARIPVGVVRSSPYCRCADTARLAFGYLLLDDDLRPPGDGAAPGRDAALARLLATPPLPGKNTVLVGDAANVRQVAGVVLREGEAAIFKPSPAGGAYALVGRVGVEQWPGLTSARTS